VRQALFSGDNFVEADLASAQLAVAACVFQLDGLANFLDSGDSVWQRLFCEVGLSAEWKKTTQQEIKAALKVAVYSVVFGKRSDRIEASFGRALEHLGLKHSAVTTTQLIEPILEARGLIYKKIKDEEYIDTPTGIHASIDGKQYKPRHALATCFQAYEAAIMLPIIRYHREHLASGSHRDFGIMLWLHDGVVLHFTRKQRHHLMQMQRLVKEEAARYQVPTRLCID